MTAFEQIEEGLLEALAIARDEKRFCGRCQSWLPPAIEIHHCVKAPRLIGYEWREHDDQAHAKNDIITEASPFKRGKLIERFGAQGRSPDFGETRSHIAIEEQP